MKSWVISASEVDGVSGGIREEPVGGGECEGIGDGIAVIERFYG